VNALVTRAPGGAGDGKVAVAYEYGPFGETVRAAVDPGLSAALRQELATQPFRFSTKFTDGETGLVYYGLRYYDPGLGRFLNRDPLGEAGGENLYAFVGNGPVNRLDVLGAWWKDSEGNWHPTNHRRSDTTEGGDPAEDDFDIPPTASQRVGWAPWIPLGQPSFEAASRDATNRQLEENRWGGPSTAVDLLNRIGDALDPRTIAAPGYYFFLELSRGVEVLGDNYIGPGAGKALLLMHPEVAVMRIPSAFEVLAAARGVGAEVRLVGAADSAGRRSLALLGNEGALFPRAAENVVTLDANAIRFSQSNVRSSLPEITQSMKANGWQGAPVDVVRMADGGLTTVDNTRIAAAFLSKTPVRAVIRNFDEVFPATRAGGNLQGGTWGEALMNRIGGQRPAWQRLYPNGSPVTGVHPTTPGFSP
jgi:RHS repeat-associated protein